MKITRTLALLSTLAAATTALVSGDAQGANASAWSAPHAPLPLLGSEGGPILATPKVVPVYFASDPLVSDLSAYFAKLATSRYLGRALAGYGVKSLTVAPAVVLNEVVPETIQDGDIATWLVSEIASGALPAVDANTVYQVIYPATTQVYAGSEYGESYQTCFAINEEAYPATGAPIPFSVVPLCEGFPAGMTDLEIATYQSTGGIATAVTDPLSYDNAAYDEPSWSGSGWAFLAGQGAGSLCAGIAAERSTTPSDLGYLAATIWSNQAAQSGQDPCPAYDGKRQTYFNAAPDIAGGTDLEQFLAVKGLILPATGGSVTIPVRLFSDGPGEEWAISAAERLDLDGQAAPLLTFAFDKATGKNGDVRHLTITRAAAAAGTIAWPSQVVPLVFEITSTKGTATHGWLAVVGNE